MVAGHDVYWNESRPAEAGRQVVVRCRPGDGTEDVVPAGHSARTLVHEYGGRSYTVSGDTLLFSSYADQRIYAVGPGRVPVAITAEPPAPRSVRFADHSMTPDGTWLLAVRERHEHEVVNDIVAVGVAAAGAAVERGAGAEPVVLARGHDFFAAPRMSPDGRRVCWLSWDHPNMPWDGTTLWVADVVDPDQMALGEPAAVAGGPAESIAQPLWAPDGALWWVSDRSNWWNLYRGGDPVAPMSAEFAGPAWAFGQSSYVVLEDGTAVASWSRDGIDHIGIVRGGRAEELDTPFTSWSSLQPDGRSVVGVAASSLAPPAIVRLGIDDGTVEVLKHSMELPVDPAFLSAASPVEFPTEGGRTAHALFYPPRNPDVVGPDDERPPLVVMSHGGPTSSATPNLDLGVQFWTSRGMAVVDVNYGGSSGYGREYRERLQGTWGVTDVDDCVRAAAWLAARGAVDDKRLVIRGRSAGGYTTLCALTFRHTFAAGASHYGVADAEALARDTHKFESRYLDRLIGPYPAAAALYRERSPIHHTDQLTTPLILFQGLEDQVVPPAQSQLMAEALAAIGVPHAYLAFEGEQHGFRRAETIARVAEAELYFYGRVLGFTPADDIEPVEIENAEALSRPARRS